MTEEEARAWLAGQLDVSRDAMERLDALRAAVIAENDRQNLVSAASIPEFWTRHIVDSAQLIGFAGPDAPMGGAWLDLGTGAGFPGMVIAILRKSPIMMVESRKLRVDFLNERELHWVWTMRPLRARASSSLLPSHSQPFPHEPSPRSTGFCRLPTDFRRTGPSGSCQRDGLRVKRLKAFARTGPACFTWNQV